MYRYEAFNLDNVRAGLKSAFGRDNLTLIPHLDRATRVLSLDSDFLGLDSAGGNAALGFSVNRQPDSLGEDGEWTQRSTDEMNRLYVVEPAFTVTGSMADHRLRLPASQVARVAAAVAQQLGIAGVTAETDERISAWVKPAVEDLQAAAGKALVLAGGQQSAEVHALVAAINEKLGAFGETTTVVQNSGRAFGALSDLREAVNSGAVTAVISTTAADPVYDAPNDYRWAEIIEKTTYIQVGFNRNHTAMLADWHVPGTHFLEEWGDVRATDGTYSVIQPMVNPLLGGISEVNLLLRLLQEAPLTDPAPAVSEDAGPVAEMQEAPTADYMAVRETFLNTLGIPGDAELAWNHALRDGFLASSAYATTTVSGAKVKAPELVAGPTSPAALEVRFVPDSTVYDGRYVNNGWLQETPDPITKLTWDNAALMSVGTFRALGLKEDGQRIKLSFNGREGYFPALQAPGHADNAVTVAVGYGQTVCGRVGYGSGFDAFRMRTSATPYYAQGATVSILKDDVELNPDLLEANHAPHDGVVKIAKWEELALTQEHNSMEGRGLVRDGSLDDYHADADFAQSVGMDGHIPENQHLYKPRGSAAKGSIYFNDLDLNHQWAMTIDLNSCLGCSSCQVACQAENNIPIVGKDQVLRGREMAWIRMDRYFTDPTIIAESDPMTHQHAEKSRGVEILNEDALEVLQQPVACQQCEAAPCESVCPVNATVHSDDGLNVMAYNRCIGTRYCANNCPYKARRFNFFDYNKRNPLVTKKIPGLEFNNLYAGPLGETHDGGIVDLQKNPNVTVRMRGVMEKCTYCVQRIETVKIAQKVEARDSDKIKVKKDAIKSACQEACPVDAIQFGNIRNEEDTVNRYKSSPRNYDLLKYVNTRPRTSYLARIKNPNLEMPGGVEVATTSKHIH
jgi:Fe-S-cluster-containing dehydrogenase component